MEGECSRYQRAACLAHRNFFFCKRSLYIGRPPGGYTFKPVASLLPLSELNDIRLNHMIHDGSNQGLKRNQEVDCEAWPWYKPGKEAVEWERTNLTRSGETREKFHQHYRPWTPPSLGLSWTPSFQRFCSTSSLLPIKSDFPSQLTWSLSLAVRRRDSHREQNRRRKAHSPSFAVASAQTLGCMPSGYVATRRYMQIGLHNNQPVFSWVRINLILITGQAVTLQPCFSPFPGCRMFIHLFLDFVPLI